MPTWPTAVSRSSMSNNVSGCSGAAANPLAILCRCDSTTDPSERAWRQRSRRGAKSLEPFHVDARYHSGAVADVAYYAGELACLLENHPLERASEQIRVSFNLISRLSRAETTSIRTTSRPNTSARSALTRKPGRQPLHRARKWDEALQLAR